MRCASTAHLGDGLTIHDTITTATTQDSLPRAVQDSRLLDPGGRWLRVSRLDSSASADVEGGREFGTLSKNMARLLGFAVAVSAENWDSRSVQPMIESHNTGRQADRHGECLRVCARSTRQWTSLRWRTGTATGSPQCHWQGCQRERQGRPEKCCARRWRAFSSVQARRSNLVGVLILSARVSNRALTCK